MTDGSVSQTRNEVAGDLAARDIHKPVTVNYGVTAPRLSEISRLSERYKVEQEANATCAGIIGKLEHYATLIADETVVGLESKLSKAGFECNLLFAQQTKELFAKRLLIHQFSESAQRIHAILLSEVYSRFHRFVSPLLHEGASIVVVSQVIQSNIIEPIQAMLEENVLELYADEINGMLYFLTGNCHIKWTK